MNNIKLFESAQIRSVWNDADGKWYFSVADVVQALTDSANVRDYIKKMRKREAELNANWGTLCPPLELLAPDGKRRLAKVGYERLEENKNSELATIHMCELLQGQSPSKARPLPARS